MVAVSRLTTDDVEAFLDLEALVFAHENDGESIAHERGNRWFPCFAALDQEIAYGIFEGDALVCAILAKDKNPGLTSCFCIEAVTTHPEYRGRGLAKHALARTLQDIERKAPEREPFINVPKTNKAARSLYQQFGFVAIDENQGYAKDGTFYIRMDRAARLYPSAR